MTRRRVVITGAGTVNALGRDVPSTLEAMRNGRLGIGPLDFEDIDRLAVRIGAAVPGYNPEDHFSRQDLQFYDLFTQFAMLSAREALTASGLSFDGELSTRAGAVLGVAVGGTQTWNTGYRALYQEGKNRLHPFVIPKIMNNAAASQISMAYNLKGPTMTISTACSSSNHALGNALQIVRSGIADVMVTGGAESLLCFGGLKAWESLRVMSKDGCRPFSRTRDGMVLGEGAAIFVFEEYEHARRRGADILAEVAGFGASADASDIVVPSQEGAARAMTTALADAGLSPEEIGYINAHGTGTIANDRTECAAVREVFGSVADRLMISSTKSMHGHLIGGTGAVELLACVLALRDGVIAPTIGHEEPDPDCDLDVVPNTAREASVSAALSNAFAFGGLNAVIALKRV